MDFFYDLAQAVKGSREEFWEFVVGYAVFETGLYHLLSLKFILLVITAIVLKRKVLKPWLEKHLKRSLYQRRCLKQRQIKDSLNDPVLLVSLEHRYQQRYPGNPQRVLQAIDNLRNLAEQEISPEDDTKGEEKKMAARHLFIGTAVLFVLTMQPWMYFFGELLAREPNLGRWEEFFEPDIAFVEDNIYKPPDGDAWAPFFWGTTFWAAHWLDSYRILRAAQSPRRRSVSSPDPLQEPLLTDTHGSIMNDPLGQQHPPSPSLTHESA